MLKIRSTILRQVMLDKAKAMKMHVEQYQELDQLQQQTAESISIGLISHCLLLEPNKLEERYAFFNGNYQGKEHRSLIRQEIGKELLKTKSLEKAQEMVGVVRNFIDNNSEFAELFHTSEKEVYLEYEDNEFLHTIKPDVLGNNYFIDYKTSNIDFPEKSTWAYYCTKYKLFIQLGYYYKILKKLNYNIEGAYHLVQTTSYPYHCRMFFFGAEDLKIMSSEADEAINIYKKMLKENEDNKITMADIRALHYGNINTEDDIDEIFNIIRND